MKTDILIDAGIDYYNTLKNLMNDQELYHRVLTALVNDDAFERAEKIWENGDRNELQKVIHEIKGMSGSAGLKRSYETSSALVRVLKNGKYSENELENLYHSFRLAFIKERDAVRQALEK